MKRQYVIHTQAWWAPANPLSGGAVESINLGFYDEERGCVAEMQTVWYELGGRGLPTPRLEAFDDAWQLLATLANEGFIDRIRAKKSIQPGRFCELLRDFDFEDATPRQSPIGEEPVPRCPSCGQEVRR